MQSFLKILGCINAITVLDTIKDALTYITNNTKDVADVLEQIDSLLEVK